MLTHCALLIIGVFVRGDIEGLEADPRRIFQWVEMVYFREWWGEQTPAKQASVRSLVRRRQLVFLTGGLCEFFLLSCLAALT